MIQHFFSMNTAHEFGKCTSKEQKACDSDGSHGGVLIGELGVDEEKNQQCQCLWELAGAGRRMCRQ
jgi:hypothetical protein